ncbi:PTS system ascorbate-specific IIA component [Jezberella montanilacus]|jgi:PTS system ascorbate-specific IIA component|uniref:PTS system ascorbate-specific IIA component n=1 Tax=Jezberella montanilacus TaxID=323426 RepID=A0A2T0XJ48_9BURK|nr:PTS mannose transporter subunit IIA [Jezberella montanilacus]PRY98910.1 PTS system ascorbate-specific IIA component [Jezberella montanilacus]
MIAIMIVAHVPLASALVDCARHVIGHDPEVISVDVFPDECAADSAPFLSKRIIAADQGHGVLVLTDLPGATPSNISVTASHLAQEAGVPCCVLGGVNASMLIRAINYRQSNLEDVATGALAGATQTLRRVD